VYCAVEEFVVNVRIDVILLAPSVYRSDTDCNELKCVAGITDLPCHCNISLFILIYAKQLSLKHSDGSFQFLCLIKEISATCYHLTFCMCHWKKCYAFKLKLPNDVIGLYKYASI